MRLTMAERLSRVVLATGLALAVLLPAAMPAAAIIDDNTLRLGTTQAMDATNPYQATLVESYESFELTWDQLVGFGPNLDPIPAFATSWERAADGKSWTFKFRPDLKWSDGQPATSADACFSWQLNLDAIKDGADVGQGYLTPGIKDAGVTKVECPDATTMIVSTEDNTNRILQTYVPILPKHIYGKMDY
ncbi:MAG TPA: ABC transporter substrate-binding protein, partial [Patescibacteria group bacterium]|nr:ABC transporter substrate-binding protein [Patescibacteria group bacterium]